MMSARTITAARISRYGDPGVFEFVPVPAPRPGPRDVVVGVKATSVNPIDCKIRSGTQRAVLRYRLPWVLGLDVSGVVTAIGADVEHFAVGDEVFGCTDFRRPGCYAEQVVVDERRLALKPRSIGHVESAGLPLAGLTAWQSLFDAGRVERGDRVFIQAGAGGVGSLAIQLAASRGAEVTTTCSARNVELVRSLGAHHVIDYTQTRFEDVVHDQDMVLDALGGDARWRALSCLKRGGRHVSICSDIPTYARQHGPTVGSMRALTCLLGFKVHARLRYGVYSRLIVQRPDADQLRELALLVDAGTLRPVIDRVCAFDALQDAHRHSETGRARGKIIVALSADAT